MGNVWGSQSFRVWRTRAHVRAGDACEAKVPCMEAVTGQPPEHHGLLCKVKYGLKVICASGKARRQQLPKEERPVVMSGGKQKETRE